MMGRRGYKSRVHISVIALEIACGRTVTEIAKRYNLSRQAIYARIRRTSILTIQKRKEKVK